MKKLCTVKYCICLQAQDDESFDAGSCTDAWRATAKCQSACRRKQLVQGGPTQMH